MSTKQESTNALNENCKDGFFQLADIKFHINAFDESTKATRNYIFELISNRKRLLEIGSGTGAFSFDFLLNSRFAQFACLVDQNIDNCNISKLNAFFNGIKSNQYEISNSLSEKFQWEKEKFDAMVMGTAWVPEKDVKKLAKENLIPGAAIIGIIREDVYHPDTSNSMWTLKATKELCRDKCFVDPFIDPIDNKLRLIFYGIYPGQ